MKQQQTNNRSKGSTLALKPRADVTINPKQGVSVAPQKGLIPKVNKYVRYVNIINIVLFAKTSNDWKILFVNIMNLKHAEQFCLVTGEFGVQYKQM